MARAGLSRARVVELALDVVEAEDLSLAAVAARAGVAVPSLYKHVASLDDLRREVAVASVRELTAALTSAAVGRAGSEALRALADAYRGYALAHPRRYAATQVAPGPQDHALRAAAAETVAVVGAVLRGFGVPEDRMVDAVRAVRSGLHGFALLEAGGGFGLPEDVDASFRFLVAALDAGIRRTAQPATASPRR